MKMMTHERQGIQLDKILSGQNRLLEIIVLGRKVMFNITGQKLSDKYYLTYYETQIEEGITEHEQSFRIQKEKVLLWRHFCYNV